jgi:hypothetical protein
MKPYEWRKAMKPYKQQDNILLLKSNDINNNIYDEAKIIKWKGLDQDLE